MSGAVYALGSLIAYRVTKAVANNSDPSKSANAVKKGIAVLSGLTPTDQSQWTKL